MYTFQGLYRKDRRIHYAFLHPSYIVKRSILTEAKLTGVRNVKDNKHQLLYRVASVRTFTNIQ